MTEKEAFINIVQRKIFDENYLSSTEEEKEWNLACKFFEKLKKEDNTTKKEITEKGLAILNFMKENHDSMNNIFTAKEIGDALEISGRSVAGSIRKLVSDGYVDKLGKNPIQYSLTTLGVDYII